MAVCGRGPEETGFFKPCALGCACGKEVREEIAEAASTVTPDPAAPQEAAQ